MIRTIIFQTKTGVKKSSSVAAKARKPMKWARIFLEADDSSDLYMAVKMGRYRARGRTKATLTPDSVS